MPLPRRVARFNKRYTNRVFRVFAARAPGFAILVHKGRKSGATYETPINAFGIPGGYRVALTYGPEADWVRNVLAAGGCLLRTRGRQVICHSPRLGTDPENRWAPWPARKILGRVGVTQYLDLRAAARGR
jgi:deazaflavin-dependent oxidoreductase (nitroreductase family)